jgi:cytochrome P450
MKDAQAILFLIFVTNIVESNFRKMAPGWRQILTRVGVSLPASIITLLLVYRAVVSNVFEPRWVQKAYQMKTSWLEWVAGATVPNVKTGHMCRKFMGQQYPDIIRFNNGLVGGFIRDFILVKDPKIAKEVLEEQTTKKPDRSYRVFRRLHGYKGGRDFLSFRSHTDAVYARTRVLAYKTLMKRTVDHFADIMLPCVERHVNLLNKESAGTVEVVDSMHRVATALITTVAFDVHDASLDQALFESACWMVEDIIRRPEHASFTWLDNIPTARNRELWKNQNRLADAILSMVEQKRAPNYTGDGDDVVAELMKDKRNTDMDLLGVVGIFFFAGFDTTANTMTMILHHLALNLDIQNKCRKEVQEVLGMKEEAQLDKLFRMPYLLAVIKETLRMFPTVPMVSREVTQKHADGVCPRFNEDDTFGVTINFFGLHYNPRGWTEPEKFLPERWIDPEIDGQQDPRQRVYCPFALGKRSCLGRQFAYIEMLAVISRILQKYHIGKAKDSSPNIIEGGTLIVDGVRIEFEDIEKYNERKRTEAAAPAVSITYEELIAHNTADKLWMAIDGIVYDLTDFAKGDRGGHPGGAEVIVAMAGADGTPDFDFVGHSPFSRKLLAKYEVGALKIDSVPDGAVPFSPSGLTNMKENAHITMNQQHAEQVSSIRKSISHVALDEWRIQMRSLEIK